MYVTNFEINENEKLHVTLVFIKYAELHYVQIKQLAYDVN